MSDAGLPATLGQREYRIVPQPIGRIRRKLVRVVALAEGVGGTGLDGGLDEDLYSLLKTFVPDLAPLYELMGYASEEDYKAGREPEDDSYDARSPTVPQLIELVQAIYTVNGADRLVRLGKALVGEDVIRHRLRKAAISWEPSASLPAASGESGSESSTPTPPTSPETSEDPSPSPDSSTSSTPAEPAAATS